MLRLASARNGFSRVEEGGCEKVDSGNMQLSVGQRESCRTWVNQMVVSRGGEAAARQQTSEHHFKLSRSSGMNYAGLTVTRRRLL